MFLNYRKKIASFPNSIAEHFKIWGNFTNFTVNMKTIYQILSLALVVLVFTTASGCKKRCGVCQKTITEISPAGTKVDTVHNIPACGRELDKMNGKIVRESVGNVEPKTVRITETRCGEKI